MRSAKHARPGLNRPATADLPGAASKGTLNPSRIPTMVSDQTRISIAKSETPHPDAEQVRKEGYKP